MSCLDEAQFRELAAIAEDQWPAGIAGGAPALQLYHNTILEELPAPELQLEDTAPPQLDGTTAAIPEDTRNEDPHTIAYWSRRGAWVIVLRDTVRWGHNIMMENPALKLTENEILEQVLSSAVRISLADPTALDPAYFGSLAMVRLARQAIRRFHWTDKRTAKRCLDLYSVTKDNILELLFDDRFLDTFENVSTNFLIRAYLLNVSKGHVVYVRAPKIHRHTSVDCIRERN